MMAIDEQHLKL